MRGSLRKLPSGAYELRVYLGTIDGRERRLSRTWPKMHNGVRPRASKKAAEEELATWVAEIAAGKVTTGPSAGSVTELIERWIARHRTDWQPRTLAETRRFVDRHIIPTIGEKPAARVRPVDLEKLYSDLAETVGRPTARRAHTHLHAAYAHAVRTDRLMSNPCQRVEPPKPGAPTERDLQIADVVEAIRQALADDNLFMAVLVRVALATGGRRGELLGLRWSDVDWDLSTVTIRRAVANVGPDVHVKQTKTGKVTTVTVDAGTMAALTAWRGHWTDTYKLLGVSVRPDWYIFGDAATPMHPDAMTGRWRKLCEAAGVSMRFHDIRHARGSYLLRSRFGPAEIARSQGHSTRTFMDVYAHGDSSQNEAMATALGAVIEAELAP